jgi:hypothetical protein
MYMIRLLLSLQLLGSFQTAPPTGQDQNKRLNPAAAAKIQKQRPCSYPCCTTAKSTPAARSRSIKRMGAL